MSFPVTFQGRLGADPEIKFSNSGTAVVTMRVVTSLRRKTGDKWEDVDTSWWQVVAFGTLGETIADTYAKGARVIIMGKIRLRTWETADGSKRSAPEITVDTIAKVDSAKGPKAAATAAAEDPWSDNQTPF